MKKEKQCNEILSFVTLSLYLEMGFHVCIWLNHMTNYGKRTLPIFFKWTTSLINKFGSISINYKWFYDVYLITRRLFICMSHAIWYKKFVWYVEIIRS